MQNCNGGSRANQPSVEKSHTVVKQVSRFLYGLKTVIYLKFGLEVLGSISNDKTLQNVIYSDLHEIKLHPSSVTPFFL